MLIYASWRPGDGRQTPGACLSALPLSLLQLSLLTALHQISAAPFFSPDGNSPALGAALPIVLRSAPSLSCLDSKMRGCRLFFLGAKVKEKAPIIKGKSFPRPLHSPCSYVWKLQILLLPLETLERVGRCHFLGSYSQLAAPKSAFLIEAAAYQGQPGEQLPHAPRCCSAGLA